MLYVGRAVWRAALALRMRTVDCGACVVSVPKGPTGVEFNFTFEAREADMKRDGRMVRR